MTPKYYPKSTSMLVSRCGQVAVCP